jgi:hypothetical protein
MKKTELRNMLKPLVRQCVKEVLLEEGLLSNIVSEVVTGFSPLLTEHKEVAPSRSSQSEILLQQQKAEMEEERRRMIKEQKIKLLDAAGFGSEIFEGVEPLARGGQVNEAPGQSALSGVDPNDAGVDISGLVALGGHKWDKLV